MTPQIFAYQAVPPTQPAVAAGDPSPSSGAAPSSGPGGILGSLPILILLPIIALLFWQSRSQQKKQEQAISGLKKGDRVVTQSGLIGRLVEIETRYAKLELAPGVKVQVLRSSLSGRDAEDSVKSADAEKSEKTKEAKE
ncbi:MAG TPA: preprotein translocase subunit YajC [Polyangiaceae bacterium]|jgi:preprotein translocase subunit YajC|nr:preprotein translocase subunit YajC [Polyangiaceae bacterium]